MHGRNGAPMVSQKNSISDGLKQPKTIMITFTIGSNQNAKEHKVFIVPDQGKFGVEWMLAHTYRDFVKKVLPHFTMAEREEPGFQAKCFELWGMLVQGNVSPHGVWSLTSMSTLTKEECSNCIRARYRIVSQESCRPQVHRQSGHSSAL